MAFNPEEFGFKQISVTHHGGQVRDYCYIRMSSNGRSQHNRITPVLCLDEETTDLALELFGVRCNIAFDENCRIVIYRGNARKLSINNRKAKTKKATIAMDTERNRIDSVLGDFRYYKYDSKIYAKGEAILLTPVGKVE